MIFSGFKEVKTNKELIIKFVATETQVTNYKSARKGRKNVKITYKTVRYTVVADCVRADVHVKSRRNDGTTLIVNNIMIDVVTDGDTLFIA